MTINKAQGPTLNAAGADLSVPCFSHGQMYCECSQTGTSENLYILSPKGKVHNIVYPEAFGNFVGH